ncbi:MAG: caspase family protein [Hyphomonas sp.]|uniref:caspase family protein n=1 Tax=Hyphomonas sp. TaxID=87 RepID=UPI00352857CA
MPDEYWEDRDADGVPDDIDEDPSAYAGGGTGQGTIGWGTPGTIGHGGVSRGEPDSGYDYYGDRSSGMLTEDDLAFLEDYELEPEPAAGTSYIKRCEANLDGTDNISVYCIENFGGGPGGDISKTSVPVEGSLDETLQKLAISLGGGLERINAGAPDAVLCLWGHEMQAPGELGYMLSPCPDWRGPPLKDQVASGAGTFDSGRVAHHAPSEMVVQQPYILELGIQPVTASLDADAADARLRGIMGTGLAPGSTETPFALDFETVKASSLMAAELIADGFSVTPITAEEQAVRADAPTVWKWMVRPEQPGSRLIAFNLSQRLQENGSTYDRAVSSTPLFVTVRTIDELLADDDSNADANEGAGINSIMSGRDVAPNTLMASPTSGGASITGTESAASGCSWLSGTDPDRFALVLSNLSYSAPISRLSVTHGDGDRVATALNDTGFSVMRCRDLGRSETIKAMRDVGRKSLDRKQADHHPVTFFYYSGHGVNVNDANYVLPIDLTGANPEEIEDGAVSFEKIFNLMSTTVASTSFIVFDACRTVMDDDSRGIVRAYSPVTWSTGVFQAYATQPGKTAADDGTYSQELAAILPTAGLPANVVFKRVQDAVAQKTSNRQRPNYMDDTTGGEFYFREP